MIDDHDRRGGGAPRTTVSLTRRTDPASARDSAAAESRSAGMVGCIYEDRPAALVGVKLAVLSAARCAPDLRILVTVPGAPARFVEWLSRFPNAELIDDPGLHETGWDVKPTLLSRRLSEGYDSVVWLDSDLILAGPLPSSLVHAPRDTLVVAQEHRWGRHQADHARTIAWGLTPGRVLPTSINTAVLRVTPAHVELLEAWRALLRSESYRAAKALPYRDRPMHQKGDQDVLDALLNSSAYSSVPVVMLRRGVDIAQCHGPAGYSPAERILGLAHGTGLPPIVHAQAEKPWERSPVRPESLTSRAWGAYQALHADLSPYTITASRYAADIGEPADWLVPSTRLGTILKKASRGDAVVAELPLALVDAGIKRVRRALSMKPLRRIE